jgi:Flp pilus assembly pilin Flp
MIKALLKRSFSFRRFVREQEGLVTIEWVGIAAIAAIASIAVSGVIFANLGTSAKDVPTNLCANVTTESGKVTTATAGGALAPAC